MLRALKDHSHSHLAKQPSRVHRPPIDNNTDFVPFLRLRESQTLEEMKETPPSSNWFFSSSVSVCLQQSVGSGRSLSRADPCFFCEAPVVEGGTLDLCSRVLKFKVSAVANNFPSSLSLPSTSIGLRPNKVNYLPGNPSLASPS